MKKAILATALASSLFVSSCLGPNNAQNAINNWNADLTEMNTLIRGYLELARTTRVEARSRRSNAGRVQRRRGVRVRSARRVGSQRRPDCSSASAWLTLVTGSARQSD